MFKKSFSTKTPRRYALALIGLLLAALLAACGDATATTTSSGKTTVSGTTAAATTGATTASGTTTAAATTSANSQLIIGTLVELADLNPLTTLADHFPEHVPQTLLFDGLTQFLPDSTIGPRLASSWEISKDGKEYTFKLNPKATWWDGKPVTADDVKFTYDSLIDANTGSSNEGAEAVVSTTVIDAQTVKITLSQSDPTFLSRGCSRGIVPQHILKGQDLNKTDFGRKPVGSGPYKLVSWQQGSSYVLEANTNYFLGAPNIGKVIIKILPNQNVLLTQLRSGEINYAPVTPRDLKTIESIPGSKVLENPTPRFYDIAPNHQNFFLQDVKVRQAILFAIDRQGIVDKVLLGHGVVIDSNATPASWAYNPDAPKHPYDPTKAKQLLTQAGFTAGSDGILVKDGKPFKISFLVNTYDTALIQALTVAQQNLKDIGIDLTVSPVDAAVFSAKRKAKEFDGLSRAWNPVYDPDQYAALVKTGNFYGYSNPEADRLAAAALNTTDQAARKKLYYDLQVVLDNDVSKLWLYSENELHAFNVNLTGPKTHPVNIFWNLREWQIQK
ncbi:ABC transporter substrate-binding protein [Candidatus Chlorohelix sp.]|uniref:ABC transporter substrate-binding protein n=1 Tax=Candidatus Chlorohelix sp. TaxID=3139201 RepID=UPI0030414EAD